MSQDFEEMDDDDMADFEDANDGDEPAEAAPDDGDEEVADAAPAKPDKAPSASGKKVPLEAMVAVRKRAQEAERRAAEKERELAYFRGRVEAAAPVQQADGVEQIDYTDIPGSINRITDKKAAAVERRLLEQQAREFSELCDASFAALAEEESDAEEVVARFVARRNSDPKLAKLLQRQGDPARWAYETQKKHEARTKDPEKEELLKRIAELEGSAGERPARRGSLASARGAGPRPKATSGPRDANAAFSDVFAKG